MRTVLVLSLCLLLAFPAQAKRLACTEQGAKDAAIKNEEVVKFCAAEKYHGCDYKVTQLPQDEYDPDRIWRVQASLIHSFDEKGSPRFMPDGFLFVTVSQRCTVTSVRGMEGEKK